MHTEKKYIYTHTRKKEKTKYTNKHMQTFSASWSDNVFWNEIIVKHETKIIMKCQIINDFVPITVNAMEVKIIQVDAKTQAQNPF